jgi:hypothetical protein
MIFRQFNWPRGSEVRMRHVKRTDGQWYTIIRLDSQPQVIVYQVLAHGRWLSPASFTTQTGRHDIAEILLKVHDHDGPSTSKKNTSMAVKQHSKIQLHVYCTYQQKV